LGGAVGVGGFLLIPPLAILGNMSMHQASATVLFTFIFTGIYATWLFHKRGSVDWRVSVPVCLGAILFGYIGAWTKSLMGEGLLQGVIAAVIVFAGLQIALGKSKSVIAFAGSRFEVVLLFGIGGLSGFGSGITGAGGPLFSVPMMLALGFGPLTAIAASQALQIAAAIAGSLGNLHFGSIDFAFASWLTAIQLIGVYVGAHIAHRLNDRILRIIVSVLCIIGGVTILVR
jgi:uncharacterized membrane protein YfcA